jgi:hypothetical protein
MHSKGICQAKLFSKTECEMIFLDLGLDIFGEISDKMEGVSKSTVGLMLPLWNKVKQARA